MANLSTILSLRSAGVIGFVLILGVALSLSFRWLLADIAHYPAVSVMGQWEESGAVGSLDEWESVTESLHSAIGFDAAEPEYYRLLGLGYDWRGFAVANEEVSAQVLMNSRRQSVQAYRELVKRRPADPVGWAHLARMKVMSGQQDDEYRLAVENALSLGAQRQDVVEEVAFAVSLGWAGVRQDETLLGRVVAVLVDQLEQGSGDQRVLGYLQGSPARIEICNAIDGSNAGQVVRDFCNAR